jgi:hypothetical protein
VYCVIGVDEHPSFEDLSGVDRAHEIEVLSYGELSAVISHVSLEDFGSEALQRNLEDLAWLERTALAHNAVLNRVRACDAVVPFRTCTIFDDQARVLEMLERERGYFREALERLRQRDEWSVKMLADRQSLEATARERSLAPAAARSAAEEAETPGHAFFARKKLDRTVDQEASAVAQRTARSAHAQLRQHAVAARLLPPQDPRLSHRFGKMILNGAYLVDRSAAGEFAATIDRLRASDCPDGVELILSGPFAPYNFVGASAES